jgi:hypothetical protein
MFLNLFSFERILDDKKNTKMGIDHFNPPNPKIKQPIKNAAAEPLIDNNLNR